MKQCTEYLHPKALFQMYFGLLEIFSEILFRRRRKDSTPKGKVGVFLDSFSSGWQSGTLYRVMAFLSAENQPLWLELNLRVQMPVLFQVQPNWFKQLLSSSGCVGLSCWGRVTGYINTSQFQQKVLNGLIEMIAFSWNMLSFFEYWIISFVSSVQFDLNGYLFTVYVLCCDYEI